MTTATRTRKINVPRLIHLAEWLGAQYARQQLGLPSEWDQSHWLLKVDKLAEVEVSPCGTACCAAGKIVLEDGWVPETLVRAPEDWADGISDDWVIQLNKRGQQVGESRFVPHLAAEILGLADVEADRLFDGNNELEAMLEVIGELLDDAADREPRQTAQR